MNRHKRSYRQIAWVHRIWIPCIHSSLLECGSLTPIGSFVVETTLGYWGPRLGTWDSGHGLCHCFYTQGMRGVVLAAFHGHKGSDFDWHKRTSNIYTPSASAWNPEINESLMRSTEQDTSAFSTMSINCNDSMVANAVALLLCLGPAVFGKQGHGYIHLLGACRC